MKPGPLVVLVLFLLAGCTRPSETDSTIESQAPPTEEDAVCTNCEVPVDEKLVPSSILELVDCTTYFMTFPIDEAKVKAAAPPGYTPSTIPPLLGLDAYVCPRAIIGNNTVVEDFQWFTVGGITDAPSGAAYDEGTDIFQFESCMNHEPVRDLFALHGFSTCNGAVSIVVAPPSVSITFLIDGQVVYEYTASGQADQPDPSFPERLRIHQGNPPTWYEVDSKPSNPDVPGEAGLLKATAGMIPQLWLSPTDTSAARGGIGHVDDVITFQPPGVE